MSRMAFQWWWCHFTQPINRVTIFQVEKNPTFPDKFAAEKSNKFRKFINTVSNLVFFFNKPHSNLLCRINGSNKATTAMTVEHAGNVKVQRNSYSCYKHRRLLPACHNLRDGGSAASYWQHLASRSFTARSNQIGSESRYLPTPPVFDASISGVPVGISPSSPCRLAQKT